MFDCSLIIKLMIKLIIKCFLTCSWSKLAVAYEPSHFHATPVLQPWFLLHQVEEMTVLHVSAGRSVWGDFGRVGFTQGLFCLHSSRCPSAPVPFGICMSVFVLYVQCVTRCSIPYLAAWVNTFVSKVRPRAVVTLLILAECSIRVQDQHNSCTRHCADSSFTSLGPKTAVPKLCHLRLQQWVKLSNSAAEINIFTAWDTRPLLTLVHLLILFLMTNVLTVGSDGEPDYLQRACATRWRQCSKYVVQLIWASVRNQELETVKVSPAATCRALRRVFLDLRDFLVLLPFLVNFVCHSVFQPFHLCVVELPTIRYLEVCSGCLHRLKTALCRLIRMQTQPWYHKTSVRSLTVTAR